MTDTYDPPPIDHPIPIEKYIGKPPGADITTLNPEFADELLASMRVHRDLRPHKVEAYRRDMVSGHWKLGGGEIKVDRDGFMIEGKHRATANKAAGVPVPIMILYGLEPEVSRVVDTGAVRTGGDVFKLEGYRQPKVVAAVATVGQAVEAGRIPKVDVYRQGGGSARFTHAEDIEWVERNGDVQMAVDLYATPIRKLRGLSQSAAVYACMRLRRLDGDKVDEFIDDTVQMKNLTGRGDPRVTLRNYLDERHRLLREKGVDTERLSTMRSPEALYVTIKAYSAFAEGRKLLPTQLTPKNGEPITYPFDL